MTATTSVDLNALVASAAGVIPDNIEYALYAYIGQGHANPEQIQNIIHLYVSGQIAEALRAVDILDGQLDGKLFTMQLEGANVPQRRAKLKSDPD